MKEKTQGRFPSIIRSSLLGSQQMRGQCVPVCLCRQSPGENHDAFTPS